MFTSYPDSVDIIEAMKAGASGAIMKTLTKEELFDAIRRTVRGERVVSPEIQRTLNEGNAAADLTPRQLEILESLARGLTYDDIAKQFGITRSGVKFHVVTLLRKLEVSNRSEAVSLALRKNIVSLQ